SNAQKTGFSEKPVFYSCMIIPRLWGLALMPLDRGIRNYGFVLPAGDNRISSSRQLSTLILYPCQIYRKLS
ncbi:hypothetical protein, partial [Microcystis aeruginosa]|uniref:hypothetical protein n=1 Tax=Microcystis aeruginosa TaxID=1126 RepID=UPI001F36192B